MYDNEVVAGDQARNIRLFVDTDGRLSDLLSKLNIETTDVRLVRDSDVGKPRGFAFVEMSDTEAHGAILALQGVRKSPMPGSPDMSEPSKSSVASELIRAVNRLLRSRPARKHAASQGHTPVPATDVVRESLLVHAVDTFGSEQTALKWLSTECGALNNRTPLQVIQERNEAEIERILDCIDYGMLA